MMQTKHSVSREDPPSHTATSNLLPPYGGDLAQLMVDQRRAQLIKLSAINLPSIDLNQRQLCDLELLLNGGFSPLHGYMSRSDYDGVLDKMRLTDGTFWPMPIYLDVDAKTAGKMQRGSRVALRDPEGFMLAVLTVEDVWEADKDHEARMIFGRTSDPTHAGLAAFMQHTGSHYLGGRVEGISLPIHYDFPSLRLGPAELRDFFSRRGWARIVAFQVDRPLHRLDHEIALRVTREYEANLLIQPVVDTVMPDNPDHYNQVRSSQAILPYFPSLTTALALLPLAKRMAGTREILWHAIIHRNYGCSHLIVGANDGDSATDGSTLENTFSAQELQSLTAEYEEILGVKLVPAPRLAYVEDCSEYLPYDEVPPGARPISLPDAEFRRRLVQGLEIPDWFSYPEVINEFRRSYPPRNKQGFTVFFTGLSGAGKSTLAKVLMTKLLEIGGRQVSLLDGDIVRKNLSSELGFSKQHRDLNVRRIGYLASEITKHRGIALCAPIAPYCTTRQAVRDMIEPYGGFFEVYVATPLEICETRDHKGLYAKARAGLIQEFTGVNDPYEVPHSPELYIDTSELTQEEAVQRILLKLEHEGFIE